MSGGGASGPWSQSGRGGDRMMGNGMLGDWVGNWFSYVSGVAGTEE
jgi:hypothetical protein